MADRADTGFLAVPGTTPDVQRMYDGDVDDVGYVMNLSRVWAYDPGAQSGLSDLMDRAVALGGLTFRQRALLVSACASAMGDAYCSLAWGARLAGEAGEPLAGGVLRGDDSLLEEAERALVRWARQVARDPNATRPADVQALRDAGFSDEQVFAITLFVAMRRAFSTVNDALGAQPDAELGASVPVTVRDAVTFGRPVASS
jgi:uncharacterized peroxidase-related enzyme